MPRPFAGGKFAFGLCDYCGLRYELNTLKPTASMGRATGFLACCDCYSPDHPQNSLPAVVAAHGADPQALKNPRPDPNTDRTIDTTNPNWLQQLQRGVA